MRTDAWSDESIAMLTKMWGQGISASQIAARLPGVSRCAVLGKARRLKLPPRERAVAYETSRLTNRRRLFVVGATVMEKAEPAPSTYVTQSAAFDPLPGTTPRPWTERESGQCTWPVGEGLSCCAAVHKKGWCEAHFDLGTQPMKPKQTAKEYERRYAA